MTREQKHPNTDTFFYYNANPKNRITGDCSYRAISLATGKSWQDVIMEMARMACDTGYSVGSKEVIAKYLESNGFVKHRQPRKPNNTKFTGAEFCKALSLSDGEAIVAFIGGHHTTCIRRVLGKFKVHDTWNCTYKCVGNYWTKA